MRRRSRAGGQPAKTPRRKTERKRRMRQRRAPVAPASKETKVGRLTRELQDALEQQTATSKLLSLISRSGFDLQMILQSVIETAARLCRAEKSVIFRLEKGVYRFAAAYGANPAYVEIERATPILPGPGTVVGRAAMARQPVRIDDVLIDPLYEKKADARVGGFRSAIGVPLMRDDDPIGVLALSRGALDPFNDKEIELTRAFANQAVIAIENARLFEAERQHTRELAESLDQQTAASEVLQVISSSPGELEPVFDSMLGERDEIVRSHTRQCVEIRWPTTAYSGDAGRFGICRMAPAAQPFASYGRKCSRSDRSRRAYRPCDGPAQGGGLPHQCDVSRNDR
jgi:GAF domain-containing protein